MQLKAVERAADHRRPYDISPRPVLEQGLVRVDSPTRRHLAFSVAYLEVLALVLTFGVFETIVTLVRWRSKSIIRVHSRLRLGVNGTAQLSMCLIFRSLVLVG